MKNIILLSLVLLGSVNLTAQKLISKTGHVWFSSFTPIEEIEAHNHQVASIINTETGDVQVSLLIRSFEFKIELMEEHFNENYMESETYPKASFKGKITNLSSVDFGKKGTYSIDIKGDLTIHGVTKLIEGEATLVIDNSSITAKTAFEIASEDYNIQIPDIVKEKIAKKISISAEIPFKKN